MSASFALLVPVKPFARAKSRLTLDDPPGREQLMRAFALDALAAASHARLVAQVYVVTEEPGLELPGVLRLPDEGHGDLNLALVHASLRVRLEQPRLAVAAMCADLPCLVPADLDAALAASLTPRWYVADAAGTGTTLLAAASGVDLDPRFGAGSARRHEASGARPVRTEVPGLRLDVDTPFDLARAEALGLGRHSRAALGNRDAATGTRG